MFDYSCVNIVANIQAYCLMDSKTALVRICGF